MGVLVSPVVSRTVLFKGGTGTRHSKMSLCLSRAVATLLVFLPPSGQADRRLTSRWSLRDCVEDEE